MTKTLDELYPNGIVETINSAVPGYREAVAGAEQLRHLQLPVSNVLSTVVSYRQDVSLEQMMNGSIAATLAQEAADTAERGGTLSAEALVDRAKVLFVEAWATQLARSGIEKAQTGLRDLPGEILREHHDRRLTGLAVAMELLVDEVKALRPLHQIDSPGSAINSDRATAHKRLVVLGRYHEQIRAEQFKIMDDETGGEAWPIPEAMIFRDVRDVFPQWAPWRDYGYLLPQSGRGMPRDIFPPWPVPGDEGLKAGFDGGSDRGAATSRSRNTILADSRLLPFLIWAVDAGADLWVPTIAELEQASSELDRALNDEGRATSNPGAAWVDPRSFPAGKVAV